MPRKKTKKTVDEAIKVEEKVPESPGIQTTEELKSMDSLKLNHNKEAKKEFDSLLSKMEKQFGEGCIINAESFVDVEKVQTKILLEDILLKGGLPKSAIVLKYGEESSGKTLSSLYEASVFTQQGVPVLYVDAEHTFNKDWAIKVGNDPKYFHIAQPSDLEKAVDITDIAVRSRKFGMVIFDSLTAAIPHEAIEKSAYDQQMALQARINSKLCQKVTSGLQPENLSDINTHNQTIVIFISHLKTKVGVVYGNPDTIPGGKSILYHASYIIKYSKGQILKEQDNPVGREIRIKVDKAKYSKPLVQGVTDFYFEPPRIDNAKTLILYATQLGLIQRAGAYFSYGDIRTQGAAELVKQLKEKPEILKTLKEAIIKEIH